MTDSSTPTSESVPAKKVGRDPRERDITAAAKRLNRFCVAHGGPGTTVVEYVSSTRTRIVVVAADGRWGDVLLPDEDAARQAARRAGLKISDDWDRESSGALRTGGAEWERMAGSI